MSNFKSIGNSKSKDQEKIIIELFGIQFELLSEIPCRSVNLYKWNSIWKFPDYFLFFLFA